MKLPLSVRIPEVDNKVPPLMVSPFKVTGLAPKFKVPPPALVKSNAAADNAPPTVSVPPVTVNCLLDPMDTLPVPRSKSSVPAKVKFPFQACG